MKGDIKHYFDWDGVPAVILDIDKKTNEYLELDKEEWKSVTKEKSQKLYMGYYFKDKQWHESNPVMVGDWFDCGELIDVDEFDKRFGLKLLNYLNK